jgi:HSP20 family protein
MLFSFEDIDRTFAHLNGARFGGARTQGRPVSAQVGGGFQRGFDPALLAAAFPGLFAGFEARNANCQRAAQNGQAAQSAQAAKAADDTQSQTVEGNAQTAAPKAQGPVRVVQPRFDVNERDGGYVLNGDLPGVHAADLSIEFEAGLLSITGRRYLAAEAPAATDGETATEAETEGTEAPARPYLEYRRKFRLSKDIDAERITARFELGVLELTLPKVEVEKPKKIAVKVN